ncbi:P63C domain-containing protein [Pandoraea nosoerga]|nr:P63C domain-containing protein [Pandoraea nosoerga]
MSEDQVTGRARGGRARAEKLSADERSAIASQAAQKRWADRGEGNSVTTGIPKVLQEFSSDLNLGGMKLPCAVIQGPAGVQRVLTEHGITNAILGGRSGASQRLKRSAEAAGGLLPLFIAPGQLSKFIDPELRASTLKPIDYEDHGRVVRGYDAAVLPAVCNIWLKAREAGALQKQQLGKAQKAEILMRALAETGIVALIDEATGYERVKPQNALQLYIEKLIRKELAAWAKKFPDEFYENIYKLKGWHWPGMTKNRYSVVAHYTRDLVYARLGPGVLRELEQRSPKNENGNRANKLHQWLTDDVGNPMLAQHLHSIILFQRLAIANGHGWNRFVKTVDQVLPKKGETMELPFEFT